MFVPAACSLCWGGRAGESITTLERHIGREHAGIERVAVLEALIVEIRGALARIENKLDHHQP